MSANNTIQWSVLQSQNVAITRQHGNTFYTLPDNVPAGLHLFFASYIMGAFCFVLPFNGRFTWSDFRAAICRVYDQNVPQVAAVLEAIDQIERLGQ